MGGERTVPYLDFSGGYMTVCICQNSQNCMLKKEWINLNFEKKENKKGSRVHLWCDLNIPGATRRQAAWATLRSVSKKQNPGPTWNILDQDHHFNNTILIHMKVWKAQHILTLPVGVWSSTLLSSIANISAAKHTKMCTRWDKLRLYIKTINTGQFKVGFSEKGCHLCRKKKKIQWKKPR